MVGISGRNRAHIPASAIVVVGENRLPVQYLYIPLDDAPDGLLYDAQHHGRILLSNYLWLDMHVSNEVPVRHRDGESAWDIR